MDTFRVNQDLEDEAPSNYRRLRRIARPEDIPEVAEDSDEVSEILRGLQEECDD